MNKTKKIYFYSGLFGNVKIPRIIYCQLYNVGCIESAAENNININSMADLCCYPLAKNIETIRPRTLRRSIRELTDCEFEFFQCFKEFTNMHEDKYYSVVYLDQYEWIADICRKHKLNRWDTIIDYWKTHPELRQQLKFMLL